MPEKMRAMVLSKLGPVESNPLKLTEIDRHEIANPKEVLVKIEACGVCHSQLHSIEGDWEDIGIPPTLPTVPGHEIVGKIVEVGNNVTKFKVGERVGITPLLGSCLDCQYCNEGKEYLCENMDVTGESLKGGYTEYITVSEDFATRVPDTMRPEYAAPLFCAGITAYKAVKAAEPEKNKKIAVFGIGGVGHMAIQFAKIEGCEVSGVSRKEKHLEVAKKLGADNVFVYSSDQKQFLQNVNEKYGELKRFKSILSTLPFPYENITPEDRYLEINENPPKVKIKFFEDLINIKNINCYSNEGNIWRKSDIKFINENELMILLKEKFKSERGRINCSLWEEGGKWRWLGIQYVIAEY